MRSRYSAFALKIPSYIIKTTHNKNQDYTKELEKWNDDILDFCNNCSFRELKILESIDGKDESFVTFHVTLFCNNEDNSFIEKSRFKKVNNRWLYHSGEFL